jgi:arylsulfatase A-like enzyme
MPLPVSRDGELQELPPFYRWLCEDEPRPPLAGEADTRPDSQWQQMLALALGMVSHVDAEAGRVLDHLEQAGLAENTIVVFTSDHGHMLGAHGLSGKGPFMFEDCVRVPLVMSAPGGARGAEPEGLACQLDLMPTMLGLVGLQVPGAERLYVEDHPMKLAQYGPLDVMPGRSLAPAVLRGEGTGRDGVVIQNDDPYLGLRLRTLVTPRHKLTLYPGFRFGELFDLQADPDELHNLWERPQWRALRDELARRLMDEDALQAPWQPLPYWNA